MSQAAASLNPQNPTIEISAPKKAYVFLWIAGLLIAYLVSVLARVEYKLYSEGVRSEEAISEAKPKLIEYVKSTMFKPASFQFKSIECKVPTTSTPYYELSMQYLANNIVGDDVPNYIEVLTDNDGNIVKVIRE